MEGTLIEPNEVHIWDIPLSLGEIYARNSRSLLSRAEIRRADRYHFEKDRARFIVARAAMRQILARYLEVLPQDVAFDYGAQGKPEIGPGQKKRGIEFNVSHSRDCALLAVTRGLRLGIDIEYIKEQFAAEDIASSFFSPAEAEALRAIAPERRVEAFFGCWTRKEAYIKALGKGFAIPLNSFDVSLDREIRPALLHPDPSLEGGPCWSMYEVAVPAGYTATLVIEGSNHRLKYMSWKKEPSRP